MTIVLAFLWPAFVNVFRHRRAVLPSILVLAVAVIAPSSAIAQENYCPSSSRSVTLSGTISTTHGGNWGDAPSVPFESFPCEEYTLTYTVSYSGPQPPQPNVWIGVANPDDEILASDIQGFSTSLNGQLPATADFGDPLVGTLNGSGNIARIKVFTTNGALPLEWSVTINLTPRPTYNRIGGLTIGAAPIVHDGDTLNVSLKSFTCCNFYKVLLKPYGTLSVTGTASNDWQNWGARFFVFVYDSGGGYQGWLADTSINPQSSKTLTGLSTYGNPTSQTQAAYLLFVAGGSGGPADVSAASVQVHAQEATLNVFLDINNNFNPALPAPAQDDGPTFIPGAYVNGDSRPLPAADTAIHRPELIAAYVDANGQIVTPPANATVTFSLNDVSAFKGSAMNFGDSRGDDDLPDYTMVSSSCPTPVDPTHCLSGFAGDGTARVSIDVWDYGGFATLRAVEGSATAEMMLPRRTGLLPQTGWNVYPTPFLGSPEWVSTLGRQPDSDVDNTPAVVDPPTNLGVKGDGLTTFEEYRGFVAFGIHLRTHPDKKDLFIAGDDASGPLGIGYAVKLPVTLHHVCDPTLVAGCGTPEYSADRVMNANRANAAGASIIGEDQRGVRLVVMPMPMDPSLNPLCTYGYTFDVAYPVPLNSAPIVYRNLSPNETSRVEVYLNPHELLSDPVYYNHCRTVAGLPSLSGPLSTAEVESFTMQTMGHEVGHAVNICHINTDHSVQPPVNYYTCIDPNLVIGGGPPDYSVMFNEIVLPAPGWTDFGALYSPTDANQIRLHLNVRP